MAEGTASPIELKRFWRLLRRRRYGALCAGLAVLSLFTWGGMLWPKTYEASSTVVIERGALADPLIKGAGVSIGIEERLRNLKNLITSRALLDRVSRNVGAAAGGDAPEGLSEDLRRNITVTVKSPRGVERETDMFTISYAGSDPRTVRDAVNTLIREYIEESLQYRRADAFGAHEFIRARLMEYKAKLEESDTAIRAFRERNPKLALQSESALLGRVEAFQTGRIDADIKMKELLRKREHIQKQLSGELQSRMDQLNARLALLLTSYTERYPEVVKIRAEIEELKRSAGPPPHGPNSGAPAEAVPPGPLHQELQEELVKTAAEIESLKARTAELAQQQREAQGMLGRVPQEQEIWTKLQRDRNVYQGIYDDLLQKLEQARVARDIEHTATASTFRVVDPAVLPTHPVKPNRAALIVLGLLLGATTGIGAAFLLEKLDYSYKDEETIERELKLPVIASIPQIISESDERKERRLAAGVFTAAGAYLVLICLVLAQELLYKFKGITIVHF